jgi:hypothetical protein
VKVPAIGDIYQYTFVQICQGQTLETVIHMRAVVVAPTDAQLKLSAENWLLSQRAIQSTSVTYPQVIIKRMTPVPFDEIRYIPTGSVAGVVNETPANNTLAIVFTKRTGVAGTTHRGRMYIGGFPTTWGQNKLENPTGLTAVGTFAGELLAKFQEGGTDNSVVAGVYSRAIGGSTPMTLAGWQPITRWDPQLIYGNQRRRRLGVGI